MQTVSTATVVSYRSIILSVGRLTVHRSAELNGAAFVLYAETTVHMGIGCLQRVINQTHMHSHYWRVFCHDRMWILCVIRQNVALCLHRLATVWFQVAFQGQPKRTQAVECRIIWLIVEFVVDRACGECYHAGALSGCVLCGWFNLCAPSSLLDSVCSLSGPCPAYCIFL